VNWTTEIITRDWLGGAAIAIPSEEVLAAFVRCERMLGSAWMIERARRGTPGTMPTLNVVAMGQRLAYVESVPNNETLVEQLSSGEASAHAELSAIYVLSKHARPAIELYPDALVGKNKRVPDFRVRCSDAERWTYVEVTQPDISEMHEDLDAHAHSVVNLVEKIKRPFAVEIFLRREPDDFAAFREHVEECCLESPDSNVIVRQELPDGLGLLIFNEYPAGQVVTGDHGEEVVVARLGYSRSILGPAEPSRQIVLRVPYSDERAERFVSREARQLPNDAPGLIMIEVAHAPGAYTSWGPLIARRLRPDMNTRVGGICLFSSGQMLTENGPTVIVNTTLVLNPHAPTKLPVWVVDTLSATAAQYSALIKSKH
jgi:hypothetical protein